MAHVPELFQLADPPLRHKIREADQWGDMQPVSFEETSGRLQMKETKQ